MQPTPGQGSLQPAGWPSSTHVVELHNLGCVYRHMLPVCWHNGIKACLHNIKHAVDRTVTSQLPQSVYYTELQFCICSNSYVFAGNDLETYFDT
eukprot:jgi/Chrzof1/4285/Cz14g07060.t1